MGKRGTEQLCEYGTCNDILKYEGTRIWTSKINVHYYLHTREIA